MTQDDERKLRPVSDEELEQSLSFALRYEGRRRVRHADDAMVRITAERLREHLQRCGYRVLKEPDAAAPSTSGHGHPNAD